MELLVKLAWVMLALIHASPAAVTFAPGLVRKLYNVEANGDVGMLLVHRGGLFLAVFVGCLVAAADADARRVMSIVTAISVLSFLWFFARAAFTAGPLRTIALVDAVALVPLALVLLQAWRPQAA